MGCPAYKYAQFAVADGNPKVPKYLRRYCTTVFSKLPSELKVAIRKIIKASPACSNAFAVDENGDIYINGVKIDLGGA